MRTFHSEAYIPEGMSLGIFFSRLGGEVARHDHDFLEIVYVKSGHADQWINDQLYKLSRGDLLFINYGSTHAIGDHSDNFEYYNVSFKPDLITERIINRDNAFDLLSLTALDELCGERGGKITFYGDERGLVESILADMVAEYKGNKPEGCAVLESYMTVLVAKIIRKLRPFEEGRSARLDMWEQLSEYISQNLDKRLTLSAVASQCFYNPSYFSRVFKDRFGMTLVDYIARERTGRAAQLLAETDMTVESVADECGFGDKTALYRAFTRIYGKTPSDYRADCKR